MTTATDDAKDRLGASPLRCPDNAATHYVGCPCHEAAWAEKLAAAEARAERAERDLAAAEFHLSRAVEALRGAEAHHDEQARLWADNESDGEADLNAQYHSERRDVFTAVLAEVARG